MEYPCLNAHVQHVVYEYTNAKYTTPLLYHPHYVIHGRLKAASAADLDLTCVRSVEVQFESNCHRRGFVISKNSRPRSYC